MTRQAASRPYVHAWATEAAGRLIVLRPCLAAVEAYALTTGRDYMPVQVLVRAVGCMDWRKLHKLMPEEIPRYMPVRRGRGWVGGCRALDTELTLSALRSEVTRLDTLLFTAEREDSVAEVGLVSALELRALLRRMRWSQARMARALDVTGVQMSQWCRGVKPVPEWVGRLAKWLEVDEAG